MIYQAWWEQWSILNENENEKKLPSGGWKLLLSNFLHTWINLIKWSLNAESYIVQILVEINKTR